MNGDAARITVAEMVADATARLAGENIESARLDAELLLADSFGRSRTWLFTRLAERVPPEVASRFMVYVERRLSHEPVAYILGRKEFMSIDFEVNRHVLIPRPETESIVQTALDFLADLDHDQHVIDLCTGSGCIAVAMAVHERRCTVSASDISDTAIDVARRNAVRAGVSDRVRFSKGDTYAAFVDGPPPGGVDAVVSNPPYVALHEMEMLPAEVSAYEPRQALEAGEDGLDIVRRVIDGAVEWLRPGGLLAVETAFRQVPVAMLYAKRTGRFRDVAGVYMMGGGECGIKAILKT
ncbi:MAG: peptide chain release factor N(5)-glutamine methyltransferase [Candidatus Hydrogenedentes bacterium]|nr:peptide chain release factor N(5)-glutamine methyltransferase [Candidatus Hydrogenedentota bacterium]